MNEDMHKLTKQQIKAIFDRAGFPLSLQRIAKEMRKGEHFIAARKLLVSETRVTQIFDALTKRQAPCTTLQSSPRPPAKRGRISSSLSALI